MRHTIRTTLLGLASALAVLLSTLGGAALPSAHASEALPVSHSTEVAPVVTTTSVSSVLTPTEYGTPLVLSATVSPDGPANLTGQPVELWLNDTLAGGGMLLYTGEGRFTALVVTTAAPNAGDHAAIVKFPGLDATHTEARGALPSESSPFRFTVAPLSSTTAIVTSPASATAFSAVDVSATVHSNGHTPTGTATLMLNDVALATTTLQPEAGTPNMSTATFPQTTLPATGTELWVQYHGSPDENIAPSASGPAQIDIRALTTRTEITLNPTQLRADEVTEVEVTVTNDTAGSTYDPVGSIQIVVDGQIVVTVTDAQDQDPQAHNGVSRFTVPLAGTGLALGAHTISAHFVPEAGFSASHSEEATFVVTAIPTIVKTDASQYTGTATQPPTVRVSVETSPANSGEVHRAVPVAATGSVQAFADGHAVGEPVRLDDHSALVRLTGLGIGTHEVELRFTPDAHLNMLDSNTSVVAAISADAQPHTDVSPSADPATGSPAKTPDLARTGGPDLLVSILGIAAMGGVLGAALLRRAVQRHTR